jgi:hypothetical protein
MSSKWPYHWQAVWIFFTRIFFALSAEVLLYVVFSGLAYFCVFSSHVFVVFNWPVSVCCLQLISLCLSVVFSWPVFVCCLQLTGLCLLSSADQSLTVVFLWPISSVVFSWPTFIWCLELANLYLSSWVGLSFICYLELDNLFKLSLKLRDHGQG